MSSDSQENFKDGPEPENAETGSGGPLDPRPDAIQILKRRMDSFQEVPTVSKPRSSGDLSLTQIDETKGSPALDPEVTHLESPALPQEVLDQLKIPPVPLGKEIRDWLGDHQLEWQGMGLGLAALGSLFWISTALDGSVRVYGFWAVLSMVLGCGFYIWRRHLKNEKALVKASAKGGWSHLILMAKKGRLDVVKLLLEQGLNVNSVNSENATALMWATQKGHIEVVKLLLERGADLNIKSVNGATAISIAERMRNRSMIQLLRKAEAMRRSALIEPLTNLAAKSAVQLGAFHGAVKKTITERIRLLTSRKSRS